MSGFCYTVRMQNNLSKKIAIVFCAVIVVAGFIHLLKSRDNSSIQKNTENKIYIDNKYPFSFEYPPRFIVDIGSQPGRVGTKSIIFYCPTSPDVTGINTDNIYVEEGKSAEESRQLLKEELRLNGIAELPTVQFNNVLFSVYDEGTVVRYIAERNNFRITVIKMYDGGEDCDYKHIFLETFKFI